MSKLFLNLFWQALSNGYDKDEIKFVSITVLVKNKYKLYARKKN